MSLWANREKMLEVDNYKSYIFTASNNKTYTYLKKRARELKMWAAVSVDLTDIHHNLEEEINFRESAASVEEAVKLLPPQKKIIYRLSRLEGLSHEQIAEKLHLSKHTVKNHLVEALRFIRNHINNGSGSLTSLMLILFNLI